jgi:DUF1365 family protein
MDSAVYSGWVRHRRFEPSPHEFRYRLFMMYLDLSELPSLFDQFWCWSARRPALARFKRSDYHVERDGNADTPLATAVRATVKHQTGRAPTGPIRLLTHLRYFGHIFNPVSFYYCFDSSGERVETVLAEITNTPWKERHAYVLPVASGTRTGRITRFEFGKTFHVSPFWPMDMRYDWRLSDPGEQLNIHMENWREERRTFDATMSLERSALSSASLRRALAYFPLITAQVTTAIYWQALRLYVKRTPFFTHPANARRARVNNQ